MEFCEGGSMFDLMEKNNQNKLPENLIITATKDACNGLIAMHNMNPPLVHRDIKIENILRMGNSYKLCDFGSTSSDIIDLS